MFLPSPFPSRSEEDIINSREENKIYSFDFANGEGKYISMVFKDGEEQFDERYQIAPKTEVRLTYIFGKGNKINGIKINKVSNRSSQAIDLTKVDIEKLLGILHTFDKIDLSSIGNGALVLDSTIIDNPEALKKHLNTIIADPKGMKILQEVAESKESISQGDIKNIGLKKEVVEMFRKLLDDSRFFKEKKEEWGKSKDEDVWQYFFEQNKWIFGYGLEYVFNAPINKEKFEKTLSGSSFNEPGKRPDGILKTKGAVQFLNIAEIKKHNSPLLEEREYRTSVWAISGELAGAVSQCHQYIRTSSEKLEEVTELKERDGTRTGEEVFRFSPKCFLIIGSFEKEFIGEDGKVLNPDKLSNFEYFRKNTLNPEIITFDELYQRAKNIIEKH